MKSNARLTTKVPGKSGKWVNFGAGTTGTCAENGLPVWKTLPLDRKLPYLPMPDGEEPFSRGVSGQQLWRTIRAHDQRFLDSNNYSLKLPYESLHDPHLRRHMKKKTVQKHLWTQGLVGVGGEALCSLQAMNQYRELRRMLNLDHVHHAINKEEKLLQEQRRLDRIREHLLRTKNAKTIEEIKEHVVRVNERKEKRAEAARKRMIQNYELRSEHLARLKEERENVQKERTQQINKQASRVKETHDELKERKRRERLKLKGELNRRMCSHGKFMEKKRKEMAELAEDEARRKWNRKKEQMAKEIQETKAMIAEMLDKHQNNIQNRMAIAKHLKAKQDAFREDVREKRWNELKDEEHQKNMAMIKNMVVESWRGKEDLRKIGFLVDKVIFDIFQESSSFEGPETEAVVKKCNETLQKNIMTPLLVLEITDSIIENSIEASLKKKLKIFIGNARETLLRQAESKSSDLEIRGAEKIIKRQLDKTIAYRKNVEKGKLEIAKRSYGEEEMTMEDRQTDFQNPKFIPAGLEKGKTKKTTKPKATRLNLAYIDDPFVKKALLIIMKKAEHVNNCVLDPRTRFSTLKNLVPYTDKESSLVNMLSRYLLRENQQTNLRSAVAMGLAKWVALKLYQLKELNSKEDPYVMRYRVMIAEIPKEQYLLRKT